jgi:hypothetical protein
MSKLSKLLYAALAIIVIAGCASEEEDLPGLVKVRLLHASPDAPRINFTVQGPFGEGTASAIDYKQGTDFVDVRFGKAVVQVETTRPGGDKFEFETPNLALAEDTNYDVMLVGKIGDETLDTLVVSNPQTAVPAGVFRMQFAHASPDTADILVYVTAPDALLDGAPSLGPIRFKSAVAPVENPAGDYQIRVALASDPLNAIYDSGSLNFAAGLDLMLTVVSNTATGVAPVSLIAQQEGASPPRSELWDVDTPADLRFVHAAPDAPALDLILDDAMTPDFSAFAFIGFSDYLDLAPGTHNIKVVDSPVPGTVEAINADPVLQIGVAYSIMATGLFANLPLAGVLLEDDNRRIATEAKLRVVNASNIAGTVNVYLAAPGAAIGPESLVPINLAFQTSTSYISLAEGDYEITLTVAGDPTQVIIDATPVTVVNGGIYTAVAIDSIGGIAPVQWILMDDFAP